MRNIKKKRNSRQEAAAVSSQSIVSIVISQYQKFANMKKYIYLTVLLVIFASCNRKQKVVEETYSGGAPKVEKYYVGEGTDKELVKEVRYYANKNVQLEGEYKDSKRDGDWVYYYENGNKWSEGSYVNGLDDGKRVTYYETGKKRYEGDYKEGKRVGMWKFYDENGKTLKEIDYEKADTTGTK
jgi:antitoxin component YwqK of YwqJK toxin-antitoxin module